MLYAWSPFQFTGLYISGTKHSWPISSFGQCVPKLVTYGYGVFFKTLCESFRSSMCWLSTQMLVDKGG